MSPQRTHYFFGQILGADDFTQEQEYLRAKARRHNRMLHGWGVVCGLDVRRGPAGAVTIDPGYALDPNGEEIVVERKLVVALLTEDSEGNSVAPCATSHSARAVKRPLGKPLHVAIRYAECAAGPVPVVGHDGGETAYSRTVESFAVKVLTALPPTYPTSGESDPCIDRPVDPWVILADVVLRAGNKIASIDRTTHRRHVPRSAQ